MKKLSCLILDSIFFSVPELSILEGVYVKVKPGIITALIGRNGSGKSTLLKIASGQIRASGGITVIDGERIHKTSVRSRFRKIGYLPQKSMLPGDLTVRRLLNSIPSGKDFSEDKIIQRIKNQKIIGLSGGERRYLEMAIIFSLDRKYILLDEPFTGVEPVIVDLIITKIKQEAQKGKGILLTDHLHRYITKVAGTAYLMHQKQCRPVNGDLSQELRKAGYLK